MPLQSKYCLHKPTNQAFVRYNGKMVYLGVYDSPESRETYDLEILQWRRQNDANGKHAQPESVQSLPQTPIRQQ